MILQNCLSQWFSIMVPVTSQCCCIVSVASRVSQHMFALLSSAKFLRKWGSHQWRNAVTGTGQSPLNTHCKYLIYFTFPLFLLALFQSSETMWRIWRISRPWIIRCQARLSGCDRPEAAEAGAWLAWSWHTGTASLVSLNLDPTDEMEALNGPLIKSNKLH